MVSLVSNFHFVLWYWTVADRVDLANEGCFLPLFSPKLLQSIDQMLLTIPFGNSTTMESKIMSSSSGDHADFITQVRKSKMMRIMSSAEKSDFLLRCLINHWSAIRNLYSETGWSSHGRNTLLHNAKRVHKPMLGVLQAPGDSACWSGFSETEAILQVDLAWWVDQAGKLTLPGEFNLFKAAANSDFFFRHDWQGAFGCEMSQAQGKSETCNNLDSKGRTVADPMRSTSPRAVFCIFWNKLQIYAFCVFLWIIMHFYSRIGFIFIHFYMCTSV